MRPTSRGISEGWGLQASALNPARKSHATRDMPGKRSSRATWLRVCGFSARSPYTCVLRYDKIPKHLALTGKTQSSLALVGRKLEAHAFCRGEGRYLAFDPNRTGPTGAVAPAVERSSDTVVERKPRAQQDHSEIRSVRAFHRVTREANGGHNTVSSSRRRTLCSAANQRDGCRALHPSDANLSMGCIAKVDDASASCL
jgi:hypothetical protein